MKRLTILAAMAVLAAACSSSTPSVSPSVPVSSDGFSLRAWLHQAIPPAAAFQHLNPPALIEDGVVLVQAPQDAMFPPGLVTILQRHTISEAGIQKIVAAAEAAGLLSGTLDFAPDRPPGSTTAELVLVIDGVEHRLTGDPDRRIVCVTTPCEAAPGTAEAFGGFWSELEDLNALVGEDLGPAEAYRPDRLALLVTEPRLDATIEPEYADWPVDGVPMAEFGVELPGAPPSRCGIVEGDELPAVVAALQAGNVYTRWRDGSGAEHGIVSRPLFPDEASPCGPS
jgi:hypothetical protein